MGNQGEVVRVGDRVRRPRGDHASAIGQLLAHLRAVGFPAPVRVGSDDEDRDVFRWIEGEVAVPPYPAWSLADEALRSVGRLLRRYHDAVRSFRTRPDLDWFGELADTEGGPIICHNDVCPENVVFRDGEAAALLDFDFAAPGRAVWDLAATARMWIPLRPPGLDAGRAHLDRLRRLAVLAEAYELAPDDRRALVDAIIAGKRKGIAFVKRRVIAGEPAFVEMWEDGGGDAGDRAVLSWLERNRAAFLDALGRTVAGPRTEPPGR
jgi:Ser/Thr protein kinase RdoA (MazF antagonist)